jgi:nucleotide-binding universal stress UspA family protein
MKVLIAADGSPYTERTLALAEKDQWFGDNYEYTVIYVVPEMPLRAQSVLDPEAIKSYYEDEAEEVFKPIRKYLGTRGVKLDFVYKVGNAAEVISRTAEDENFDLIIMGTQGRGRLNNLVMGSVVTGVLARCETVVVLVH